MASFSAVLLAGGASKRMGQDKALVCLPDSPLPLWQRQWKVLEELSPEEIFWSGPLRPGMPSHLRSVPDTVPQAGPLGGISASLDVLRSDLLAVLAVDLPQMSTAFLHSLLSQSTERCGAVGQRGDFFEPLAAIYPKALRRLAEEHLAQGRYAMQDFIREAVKQEMLRVIALAEATVPLFKNLNAPTDFQGL